ncbi:MAG: hypothetical protein KGS28_04875 [Betaproteobacteria bacterium]|nr:hypothetical protein [Betaproteobacteria bacterium]
MPAESAFPLLGFLSGLKDVFVAGAAAVTAGVAVIGLGSWKRDVNGRANFEVARALVRSTYKLANAIAEFRSPAQRRSGYPDWYQRQAVNPPDVEAEALQFALRSRMRPLQEALQAFEANALEAEALWGRAVRVKTSALSSCVADIKTAATMKVTIVGTDRTFLKVDPKMIEQIEATLESALTLPMTGEGKDPFALRVENAIRGIEELSVPRLRLK